MNDITPTRAGVNSMVDWENWVDLADISAYLGIDPQTIRRLREQQGLPMYKVGREWRAKRSEIDEWIKQTNA